MKSTLSITLLPACFASVLLADDRPTAKVAAIVTAYYHNSHADCIVSRLLETDTLDGKGNKFRLELASCYVDQISDIDQGQRRVDKSRQLLAAHSVRRSPTIRDALTLGTGKLAVDGVLLICEHGEYPDSELGSTMYPKRQFFSQIIDVCRDSNRFVPVFCDKHLADNWADAKWMYDTAKNCNMPLLGGSSVPLAWRYPPLDIDRNRKLKDVVAISYHRLDIYGFHGLEMLQSMVERRPGGEAGIKAVRCLSGDAVWEAGERGVYDRKLLLAALARQNWKTGWEKRGGLKQAVKEPVLVVIEHADGLRSTMLTLNGAVGDWCIAWRYEDGEEQSTLFATQEARPLMHFTYLVKAAEEMILTGKPPWPIERTLLTSGTLEAMLLSRKEGGRRLETPHLVMPYQSAWNWQQPPDPPPGRPFKGQ